MDNEIIGTEKRDTVKLGSGVQTASLGAGNDRIISFGDAGEPDPAQTEGADGRVTTAQADGSADDTITGGAGADKFEWHALLNAKPEVIAEHTNAAGRVNWANVAGDNDNVHDHWVEGFGLDTVTDFNKAEGDSLLIKGHTATIADITYGTDAEGDYSLVTVISQQGDGGAGGANTETGAHDEDPLGQIKIYGDRVTRNDIQVENNTDGIDRLIHADKAFAPLNGAVTQEVYSNTDGAIYEGSLYRQTDKVHIGEGHQTVNAGGGHDRIYSYSDGGEPEPAQTDGAEGRVNAAISEGAANDTIAGGQGKDYFAFRLLLNAKDEIIEKYTRDDGSINWRGVAGENDNVHDHWVEGIGDDVILDFSNQDGDKIDIRGHTVEIASITYDEDDGGDFSLITLRSQQGDGGAGGANTATGAHDEDPLGTIKVYGDKVTEGDITTKANVFYGVDQLGKIAESEQASPADTGAIDVVQPQWGADTPETIDVSFEGTSRFDHFRAGSGTQRIDAGGGNDRIISYGDAGEPDPAQTDRSEGRVNASLSAAASDDVFTGGDGRDHFEFRALLNAKASVLAQHTNDRGYINWRAVAGENDNVHDHWVEGFGADVITDFSKEEGDQITVRGHTVEIAQITYSTDDDGDYSLIAVRSQQGDGGAGGANTATGAHDEDDLGTIKVYGDRVETQDIKVKAAGIFDGVDQLQEADLYLDHNGGTISVQSSEDGAEISTAPQELKTRDWVEIGSGAQTVSTGAGRDKIWSYADAGEPDPAQTDGSEGRISPPVPAEATQDVISGGQGKDSFTFNMLLNATDVILARYTKEDGSIKWRQVAGENEQVHDHWVEGIGADVITNFSNQDGDTIELRGHTVEIADITYGDDGGGDFSVVSIRSQQGDGGGAHDEDPLGSVKVYGDRVTQDDIKVKAQGVFDGIDKFEPLDDAPNFIGGSDDADDLNGTDGRDNIHGGRDDDIINAGASRDFLFGGGGNDQLNGGSGDDWLEGSWGRNTLDGGIGADVLASTKGRDTLTGGVGEDIFLFNDAVRSAEITDWEGGIDLIDLSRLENVDDFSDICIAEMSDTTSVLSFENDKGNITDVTVASASAFSLTADDFIL